MAVTEKLSKFFEPQKMITNYIYFYHLDMFCVLPVYPESITDNTSTTFQPTTALSRSAPVQTYSNSGPRSIDIQLELHRDLMNDLNTGVSNFKLNVVPFQNEYDEEGNFVKNDYIDLLIKYLMAAALPKYQIYNGGSKAVQPPMVAVRFGDDIFIKGIVNSGVRVTYQPPIITTAEGLNRYAKIQVGFSVTETDPYDAESVLSVGSFRGICGTNNIYSSNSLTERAQFYDMNTPQTNAQIELGNNTNGDFLTRTINGSAQLESGENIEENKITHKKQPYINSVRGKAVETYNGLGESIGGSSRGAGAGRYGG